MPYTAFAGTRRIASGDLAHVALQAKTLMERDKWAQVVIFDDVTSAIVDLDFRDLPATPPTAPQPEPEPRRAGRPKLGVVAREVTLLPRHWDWLASQPGGASVALRKLVEHALRDNQDRDRVRRAQESAYRFLSTMAGNLPDFEEATRALFANRRSQFNAIVDPWPADIRDHVKKLASLAFAGETE
jgi:hypothetical protein